MKYKLEHPEKAEGDEMKFQESDGDSFEEMCSINQSLSFDALRQEFKTRKIPFAEEQILQVLSRQKEITRKEVQELLEVSQSTAGRISSISRRDNPKAVARFSQFSFTMVRISFA